MQYHDTVILLYAKAPVEGQVNTRLIPDIGVKAATELQHELIHHRLSMLNNANLCAVNLMCAPDKNHEVFKACNQKYSITLLEQVGENLGERMFNGVKEALNSFESCIVIGTDAPALDAQRIEQVIERLHTKTEVVLVPAEDGGYVLVGTNKPYDFMFQNINWGTSEVMQQTRICLREHNVLFSEIGECWDVDHVEDYQRYLNL